MFKYKVLHIHTLPVISGSGINTFLSMVGIDRNKYEVEFACAPGGALVEQVLEQGITFRPIKNFVQPVSIGNDMMALWELVSLLKCHNYDIVHTHNSKAGFIGRLAAKIAGVPIIIHTIHGFAFHEFERPPRQRLFILLEKFAAGLADCLIAISNPLKEWGLRLGIGRPDQYITIYSGIEIDKFHKKVDVAEKKRQLGISAEDKVVGIVSKLWDGKGHHCLLRAAKNMLDKFPQVKFLIVGEGYLRKELEELAVNLDLKDHVIFTGFRSDIPEITATFDISVLASFFEGMGRVLLEAMAFGKPVVATKVGGIVDVVDDGQTGILVAPNNPAELTEAILRLLTDDELCRKMGKAARIKVDNTFSAKTMVCRIEEVYDAFIVKKKGLLKKRGKSHD